MKIPLVRRKYRTADGRTFVVVVRIPERAVFSDPTIGPIIDRDLAAARYRFCAEHGIDHAAVTAL